MDGKLGLIIVIRRRKRLGREGGPGVDLEVLEEEIVEDLDQEVEIEEDD